MKRSDFNLMVEDELEKCKALLKSKGGEYSGDEDVFANFKRGAGQTGATPLQTAFIFLSKHYDAVATYVKNDAKGLPQATSEPIAGRLQDLINYCLLVQGMVMEGRDIGGEVKMSPQHTEIHLRIADGSGTWVHIVSDVETKNFVRRRLDRANGNRFRLWLEEWRTEGHTITAWKYSFHDDWITLKFVDTTKTPATELPSEQKS